MVEGLLSWQDVAITGGQVMFILALLPALSSPDKPPLSTCVLTGGTLVVFSVTFGSLGLVFGSGTAAICAALWFVLGYQQIHT